MQWPIRLMEMFLNSNLGIETIYLLVVVISCVLIMLRIGRIYSLSGYDGVKYLGYAFFFFAIGFIARYASTILKIFSDNAAYLQYSIIMVEYSLSIAGLLIIYSLIWKNLPGEHERKPNLLDELVPAPEARMILLHIIAMSVALIDHFNNTQMAMYVVQIALAVYACVITYRNYLHGKQHKFLQFYFICMILSAIGWTANFFLDMLVVAYPLLMIYVYTLTSSIFLIFFYGIMKLSRDI